MIFPRRARFEFRHPNAKGPVIFKAWSETGARKKMRSFLMRKMFGDWALSYDAAALAEVMAQVSCRRLPVSAGAERG
jgi:hypothetical protein